MSQGTPPPPDEPTGSTPPGGAPPPPSYGGSATPPPGPGSPPAGGMPGGYSAAPPPPPPIPQGARPAELLDRFLARLIDFVILIVVNLIITSVILAAVFTSGGGNSLGIGSMGFSLYGIVSAIITTVLYVGYFAFMESSQGKTVGKMVMKTHVEGPTGAKPTLEEALKRNAWLAYPILGIVPFLGIIGGLLGLVAVILIAVQINSDPEKRPFTDKFAGTRVIKEG